MQNIIHISLFPRQKIHAQFTAIMQKAELIAAQHPPALLDLVRLLGRKLQAERIAQLVLDVREHPPLSRVGFDEGLFDRGLPVTPDGQGIFALTEIRQEERVLSLARDVLLPWPWNQERLVNALCTIGTGKSAGPWEEDRLNHRVEWWLPVGIGWIEGGNHSLAAGIVQAEGSILVQQVHSLHRVYEYVTCDGRDFRRTFDQYKICQVRNPEWAAIFEIGRLMLKYGVSA